MKVIELLDYLDEKIPLSYADSWDNPGMSVGNPDAEVCGIATALDVTPETIQGALGLGANVLVTHHPIFLEAPNPVTPTIRTSSMAGVCTWMAAHNNLSIISMHTNLDKSTLAQRYLASVLGFDYEGSLEDEPGFGAIMKTGGIELAKLAKQCAHILESQPTVWGLAENRYINRLVYCSGSCGDLGALAIQKGIECVICGECGYHKLLEMNDAGVAAIILGHDTSEKPFAHLLAEVLKQSTTDICIQVLDEPKRWKAFV